MKTLVGAAEKGGAGKTKLAHNLAVTTIHGDQQGSSLM